MPRRSPLWFLACLLALATGLALLRTGELLTSSAPLVSAPSVSPAVAANAAVVRRFYAAVNGFVHDGDATALDAVVAPDFLDHVNRPGLPATRSGLLSYLGALRATFPALRLTVASAVADQTGGRVLAQVRLDGTASGDALGLPLPADTVWGPFDAFRVAAGQVREHWGSRDPSIVEQTLAQAHLALPTGPQHVVTLDRLSFPPRAVQATQPLTEPRLDYVESGTLDVAVGSRSAAPAEVWGARGSEPAATIAAGSAATVSSGDVLVLPKGATFTARIASRDSTSLLEVDMSAGEMYPSMELWPDDIFSPDPAAIVADQSLAGGRPTLLAAGDSRVGIARLTLGPATSLSLPAVGPTLLSVAAGRLGVETTTGTMWVLRAATTSSEALGAATLVAGDGAQIDAGGGVTMRNAGPSPLVILVAAIRPESEASPGTPAA